MPQSEMGEAALEILQRSKLHVCKELDSIQQQKNVVNHQWDIDVDNAILPDMVYEAQLKVREQLRADCQARFCDGGNEIGNAALTIGQ